MTKREEYVEKMHTALDRLQVKASLAKLELRDLRGDLAKRYDRVLDRLHELGDATGDRWEALKEGVDSAWHSFRQTFDEAMARHREDSGERP